MLFFLILSPYMAFTAMAYVASLTTSVAVAALVSLAINLADHLRGRTPKAIGLASTTMFAGLAAYFILTATEWSGLEIRLALDLGIFAVALISIALRRPFTLQYARERVDEATQREPTFVQINYVLTWVWASRHGLDDGDRHSRDLPALAAAVGGARTDLRAALKRGAIHQVVSASRPRRDRNDPILRF